MKCKFDVDQLRFNSIQCMRDLFQKSHKNNEFTNENKTNLHILRCN